MLRGHRILLILEDVLCLPHADDDHLPQPCVRARGRFPSQQVAEGGLFVGADDAMGELEINCLHSLEGNLLAEQLSTQVIKGVWFTSLEGAKALVAAGQAKREDFWVCVGYSGWAPGQLQMEVDTRDSWTLASADCGTLLSELLQQAQALPPPSASGALEAQALVGIDTWSSLMRRIGRGADVDRSEGVLADRMLGAWVRRRLLPPPPPPPPLPAASRPEPIQAGDVLCSMVPPDPPSGASPRGIAISGRPADRFLLVDQFLHKAVMLVLDAGGTAGDEGGGGGGGGRGSVVRACVLNRPTNNLMRFRTPGNPRRRVAFTGNRPLRRADGTGGQLWLHRSKALGGQPVGGSGFYSLPSEQVEAALEAGTAQPAEVILVSGVVEFRPSELAAMLTSGEVRRVPQGEELDSLWPRAWALMEDDGTADDLSDGTEVWWRASQCGADGQLAAAAPSELADEALDEWLKFFARGVQA
jgi:hypothetical protein